MLRGRVLMLMACLAIPAFSGAGTLPAAVLDAAEIADKNIAARGGQDAWKKIQSIAWVGHIDSTHAPQPSMPFVLEMKRPNKTRFEINAQTQKSVRIFDGTQGWKLLMTSNGKPNLQPYTDEELEFARHGFGIDSLLMNYQSQGISLSLEGVDDIEGRQAYRLAAMLPSGGLQHVWIDTQSFLDIKYDRKSITAYGQPITVPMFYRNYQTIGDLRLPLLIETGTGTGQKSDNMVIDKVLLNPPLEDALFLKPNLPQPRNAVTVNATSLPGSGETR